MAVLLVSLGTSPAIVPEAFLLPGVKFDAVHVLTTESTSVEMIPHWFAAETPGVELTISRVKGFQDFKSEEDHFRFEEVLYRWYLEKSSGAGLPYVCLSGGFKTMSAAMQKAAGILGAAEVFHVLADGVYPASGNANQKRPAATLEEIKDSFNNGHLHWIRLGAESGWPQFREYDPKDFPLTSESVDGFTRVVSAPDSSFRDRLHEILTRSRNIAGAWEQLGDLPFPVLATWSGSQLEWLRQPVDPDSAADRAWIGGLPKIELHCHLGGFATHGELLRRVRESAENPDNLPELCEPPQPERWPLPEHPIGLPEYMRLGDANGSKLLRDPGCLRAQCRLLYEHLLEQNVVYAEIRCSPNNYTSRGRSAWRVLEDIREEFQSLMDRHPDGCRVNLLVIATRRDGGDRSDISRHLALAITAAQHWTNGCHVVGVDLAGFEHKDTRAALFATDFEPVHRVGLAVTVHAGENDDAEGIWQAVFKLNARRLGHALRLIEAPDLERAVADRRIGVEMCPFANFQIKGFPLKPTGGERSDYPLRSYLRGGIRVTVNTDNIGISSASLTDNLLLAARLCPGLTRMDILRLQSNALESAFLAPSQRAEIHRRMESRISAP